jgi:hypothetical protein
MATRGQVKVWDSVEPNGENEAVWLTQHYDGMDLPGIVKRALKRGDTRWNDSPYLARVIFCQMLMEEGRDNVADVVKDVAGFGIQGYEQPDSEWAITLDMSTQTITVFGDGEVQSMGDFASFVEDAKAPE